MVRIFALTAMCITALSACSALQITEEPSPVTVVQVVPSHNRITTQVQRSDGGTVIDIRDPRGIGTLDMTFADGAELPILRLHLAALEELTLRRAGCPANAPTGPGATLTGVTLTGVTVTTHGSRGSTVITRTHQRGELNGEVLDSDSAALPAIAAFQGNGAPAQTVPLDDGYFEVTLPPALECDGRTTLSISWIDFYR